MADRILGVDPGTRVCGWGVIDRGEREPALVATGVIEAKEGLPIAERLKIVFEGLTAVIAEHRPGLVAVEEAFFGKNVRSAIRLGEGRGTALLAAALAGIPVVELQPSLVKKAVTGHGAATKDQVRTAIEATLKGDVRATVAGLPLDATDALALAVAAHARSSSPALDAVPRRKKRGGARWTQNDLARLGLRETDPHG